VQCKKIGEEEEEGWAHTLLPEGDPIMAAALSISAREDLTQAEHCFAASEAVRDSNDTRKFFFPIWTGVNIVLPEKIS
jgi:hypothetical protein